MKRVFVLLGILFFVFPMVKSQQPQALRTWGNNNNYMRSPHFPVPESMSVEAWIKVPDTNGTKTIVSWKNVSGGDGGDAVLFRLYGDKLQFGEWIGGLWTELVSTVSIKPDEWTHVGVTRKGKRAVCYINGLESGRLEEMHFTPKCTSDNLSIAAIATVPSESFVGALNEVRIWDTDRTASEIAASFTERLDGTETNLIAYWPLDGNLQDLSPFQRHGSEVGTASYVDRFSLIPPQITNLSFFENSDSSPYIELEASQKGKFFWAITQDQSSLLKQDEILLGGENVEAKGIASYENAFVLEHLEFAAKLIKGNAYKLYALLLNEEGRISEIKESPSFVYNDLSVLPQGWYSTHVGGVAGTGTASYQEGSFLIKGAGTGILEGLDDFQLVYQRCSGDFEIKGEIVRREDENATVGLSIRGSKDPASLQVFVGWKDQTPVSMRRAASGGTSSINAIDRCLDARWFKIIRKDGWLGTYCSADGANWEEVHYPEKIDLGENPFVGLLVASGKQDEMAEATFSNVLIHEPDKGLVLSDIGVYFYKKKYEPEPIPTYADNKHRLPKPILEANPGWIAMSDKCWQLLFSHIKAPVEGSPLVSNWYDEAFDNSIFQWDIIFMTMFGKYANHVFPGIQSLDNFYCRQGVSGSICRRIDEESGRNWFDENSSNLINPPLFAWAEVENYKVTGDKSRFERVLPVLEKYFEFVENARVGKETPHELYWSNGQASGMDNTPRDTGREGGHFASDEQGWVDMSCQMVMQCNDLATICDELGYAEKAEKYRAKASEIAARIHRWMWNEEDGLFYDVDVNGKQTRWNTIASFWPMLAGITTQQQTDKLIAHLKNPAMYWRDIPFATLSATHSEYQSNGGYWRGAVWAPTNYATIKGIQSVGEDAFAKKVSEKYLEGLYQVFLSTGTLWENYAADQINGQFVPGVHDHYPDQYCRPDFVGWTGVGPIALLIENVLGFRVNGADKVLTYDLRRTDRHGIENLQMADITTTIICEERKRSEESPVIRVTSDKPYQLLVLFDNDSYEFSIEPGTQLIALAGSSLSSQQIPEELSLRIHENPVRDLLTFDLFSDKPQSVTIDLMTIGGKVLFSTTNTISDGSLRKEIAISQLKENIFLLSVKGRTFSLVEKIIKLYQ